jgi:predicted nuclease of predicted toxin-antitoxin system
LEVAISLYLDENLSPKIAVQLRQRGIDAISVHELGLTGDTDDNHLQRAIESGRVLVSADSDFLIMVANGMNHVGIIFGNQSRLSLGDWVNRLELVCRVYQAQDMVNHIEYL